MDFESLMDSLSHGSDATDQDIDSLGNFLKQNPVEIAIKMDDHNIELISNSPRVLTLSALARAIAKNCFEDMKELSLPWEKRPEYVGMTLNLIVDMLKDIEAEDKAKSLT